MESYNDSGRGERGIKRKAMYVPKYEIFKG